MPQISKPLRLGLASFASLLLLAACNGGRDNASAFTSSAETPGGNTPASVEIDRSCDNAPYPSAQWTQCELQNFGRLVQATTESLSPAFQAAQAAQSLRAVQSYVQRLVDDPTYLPVASPQLNTLLQGLSDPAAISSSLMSIVDQSLSNPTGAVQLPLNTPLGTECAMHLGPCVGDPFRYPEFDGPDGRNFYENEAQVDEVTFYDRECARLSGHVWRPRDAQGRLPTVVFEVGSVGAPETLYWWLPQLLVRNGYEVLSFEVRGQGRSDFSTPNGGQGTNINPKVFWENFVDAIDFVRSSPATPYPNELSCAGTYPTVTARFNPHHETVDLDRLGIAGHSLGAIGVSAVQGYGATGADPWPGQLDTLNPVDVGIGFDGLVEPGGVRPGGAIGPLETILPEIMGELARLLLLREFPNVAPRVPTMSQTSEYGLLTTPFVAPPDAEFHKGAYLAWQAAGVPMYEFTVQGSTHSEWSQVPPVLPGSSFCPDPDSGACRDGHGLPQIEHYTLAWFDRWLKNPGEPGYATADARLLDDGGEQGANKMSFRFHSARDYPDRSGQRQHCEDIRAGCS